MIDAENRSPVRPAEYSGEHFKAVEAVITRAEELHGVPCGDFDPHSLRTILWSAAKDLDRPRPGTLISRQMPLPEGTIIESAGGNNSRIARKMDNGLWDHYGDSESLDYLLNDRSNWRIVRFGEAS